MLFDTDIRGDHLPPKTICLTYDDGPGDDTERLANFLHTQQIRAAFFVIGAHAIQRPELLQQIAEWGHLIGNHTYSHPGLVQSLMAGGDITNEILRVDPLIRRYSRQPAFFLRAPYGSWREVHRSEHGAQGLPSAVARELNGRSGLSRHVGHIHWNICTCDYDFWRRQASVRDCAEASLEGILRAGRGIVLLHDSSESPEQRKLNRTRELTEVIVPCLQREGYNFVGLDEIPEVRSAMLTRRLVNLLTPDQQTLGMTDDQHVCLRFPQATHADQWGLVPTENRSWALRAPNGCYLNVTRAEDARIAANGVSTHDANCVRCKLSSEGTNFYLANGSSTLFLDDVELNELSLRIVSCQCQSIEQDSSDESL